MVWLDPRAASAHNHTTYSYGYPKTVILRACHPRWPFYPGIQAILGILGKNVVLRRCSFYTTYITFTFILFCAVLIEFTTPSVKSKPTPRPG